MRLIVVGFGLSTLILAGCDNAEVKEHQHLQHLASLSCNSSKAGRSQEELQAIADACFKGGSFHKSKEYKW